LRSTHTQQKKTIRGKEKENEDYCAIRLQNTHTHTRRKKEDTNMFKDRKTKRSKKQNKFILKEDYKQRKQYIKRKRKKRE